jgi:hypothetical protein
MQAMKKLTMTLCLGLTLFWASSACAILIDPYDNFLAPDGYYGLVYGNYYTADKLVTSSGNLDVDLQATVSILRGLKYFHVADIPVAFQVIVPFGEVKETKLFNEKSSGLGDIIFGPGVFLHADQETNTYLSYWFYAFAPTGEWDATQALNLGRNTWYFEHQLAFGKMMGAFVYDMNLNFYHFTEESDNNYTAPNRFEFEASLAYQATEQLSVGLNGGGYWDLDDGEIDGNSVAETKAKRVQLGPSLNYQINEKLGCNLRWTHDLSASNDTKGDDFWLRFAYAF